MKIALIAKLWEPTSPSSTGGTGLSVGTLANELVARGHAVTLFATGDSRTRATLVAVRKQPWQHDYSEPIEYLNIAQAFSMANKFDVLHCHVEHKAALFANLVTNTPHLMTIRYGEFFRDELTVLKKYRHLNWSANSHAITKLLPFLNFRGVVHNGLDLSRYPFQSTPADYALFLGRLCPQKAPHIAIAAAKKAGIPLILAGKTEPQDETYLKTHVWPYVDQRTVGYVGVVSFKEKIPLLKNALALLHPNGPKVVEACSNTILEAQACGTPVIAYDSGSNRELMRDGITGAIVTTPHRMAAMLRTIQELDRSACRSHIQKNFTARHMADGYEALYRRILS